MSLLPTFNMILYANRYLVTKGEILGLTLENANLKNSRITLINNKKRKKNFMLKKNFFKSYAIIIALAAILILPVLVNAQDMSAFQAKGMEAKAAQPMAKCMAQKKGNQALCEKKVMDYLERRNSAGSQAQQGSADGSPPSAMGSDPRSQTRGGSKSMGSDPARAKRDNRGGAKASPLCQINPRHLNKRALKKREKRCN